MLIGETPAISATIIIPPSCGITARNAHANSNKLTVPCNKHDYGNGKPLTMIEVHTLTYTELTNYWHKTKGAISQIVSRPEDLGLVKKTKKDNAKNVCLYFTENGFQISRSHKLYDTLDITKTLREIQKKCTSAEISKRTIFPSTGGSEKTKMLPHL